MALEELQSEFLELRTKPASMEVFREVLKLHDALIAAAIGVSSMDELEEMIVLENIINGLANQICNLVQTRSGGDRIRAPRQSGIHAGTGGRVISLRQKKTLDGADHGLSA